MCPLNARASASLSTACYVCVWFGMRFTYNTEAAGLHPIVPLVQAGQTHRIVKGLQDEVILSYQLEAALQQVLHEPAHECPCEGDCRADGSLPSQFLASEHLCLD